MIINTIPELVRKETISDLLKTNTLINTWPHWKDKIKSILGENYNHQDILDLGDNLSKIFRSTSDDGRSQSSLSGGGHGWEALICWYLNLCCVGSRVVTIKKMSHVPTSVKDSITVNYGNFQSNSESDLVVLVFPDIDDYKTDINHLQDYGNETPTRNQKLNSEYLNAISNRDFLEYEIGIIQSKTNWNDNAQIPMLWDMIYSSTEFSGRNISIGKNGRSIQQLANKFSYSFVTVPTIKSEMRPGNMPVKRVANLSGGNFWGKPSSEGVARSIKEIFEKNFAAGFDRNSVLLNIEKMYPYLNDDILNYFDLFD
jgi:hypothetical protein